MNNIFLLLFLILFLTPNTLKAQEVVLTLDEAITLGLRDNKDVLLKTEDVKKYKAKISEVQSALFPSLTATVNWSDTKELYTKDAAATQWGLGVKQIIYKGGKVLNSIEAGKYSVVAAEALLDKTKLDLIVNIKRVFYLLLYSYDYLSLNKKIVDNVQEHIASLKERYKNGEISESEIINIESSLSNVKEAYEISLNQLEATQEMLSNLLNCEKELKVITLEKLQYDYKEMAYDEAFLQAMQESPEIKQFGAQEKAASKNVEAAKADARPTVFASWDYYNRTHSIATTTRNQNDYNVLGLTLSWPIFDGWLTKSKVDQAIVDFKESQLLREKSIQDVSSNLKYAYLELKNSIEKIKSLKDKLKVYENNVNVFQKKFEVGIVSEIDLHDAKLSQDVSLFNQSQAIYDYLIARAKFDRAAGGK